MPDKWGPKAGKFYVDEVGAVSEYSSNLSGNCGFGNEYATREQAEKAAKAMRAHNRLLAYAAEFAPDWAANWGSSDDKCCVYYNHRCEVYEVCSNQAHQMSGTVYIPYDIAEDLCSKLNSGEVEL